MKLFLTSFTILVFIHGCVGTIPFEKQTPLENASLVYVYFPSTFDASYSFNIGINDKRVKGSLNSGEYMAFDVKPNTTNFSVIKLSLESKYVKLALKSGSTYFLRATHTEDGFNFKEVKKSLALKEIVKTGLSGSTAQKISDSLTELVVEEEEQNKFSNFSKIDEIKKAYELKESGILSDTEFKKLKQEILAK